MSKIPNISGRHRRTVIGEHNKHAVTSTSVRVLSIMVLYTLFIKADLDNVARLVLREDADLCFSVRHPVDHDQVRERIVVDCTAWEPSLDEIAKKTGHHDHHHSLKQQHHPHTAHHAKQSYREPPCHFAMKWDHHHDDNNNNKRATIRVIKESRRDYVGQDSGTFVPVLQLDCDGLEPYAFHPVLGNEFSVTTNRDSIEIPTVDLSDNEWSDYDLGRGSTSIINFESKFE